MASWQLSKPPEKIPSALKIRIVTQRVPNKLMSVIGDEDTCVGFLMVGVGNRELDGRTNYMIVNQGTTAAEVEECFISFLGRGDIAIIIICQNVADMIRNVVDAYEEAVPAVLEIPSRDNPYDPEKDSILKRAKKICHTERFAFAK